MKLTSVQVQNYKIVEDSNAFEIAPITCMVGKNESGKSALLQALHKLKPVEGNIQFDDVVEYPRSKYADYKEDRELNANLPPGNVLTTTWTIEPGDREAVESKLGPGTFKSETVVVTKGYDNRRMFQFDLDESRVVAHYLKPAQLSQDEMSELEGVTTVEDLIARLERVEDPSQRQEELLEGLREVFPKGTAWDTAADVLGQQLPAFIYFPEYEKLPGQVSIDEWLAKPENQRTFPDRMFQALLQLAGTGPEEINKLGRYEQFSAELEAVSSRLTQQIKRYWSQNLYLTVEFRFDEGRPQDPQPFNRGYVFRTRIRNDRYGGTVNFDERSSGFIWFFSFLVWFSQMRRNYGDKLLILLDEPGLSLHAKAQGDLLRYMNERLRPTYQVIYTTHSPFMVDPDYLDGVRTVEDVVLNGEPKGTKVGDKVFSTDADTLFPLQAALGYDITQTLFVGKHTLLVEGPADIVYMDVFSQRLGEAGRTRLDRQWTKCPVGGIEKVGSFLALFRGSQLHVAVFTDLEHGQKRKVRDLKEKQLLKSGHVLTADMYADQGEADIEDLLGRSLYVELVNHCYSLDDGNRLPEARPEGAPTRVVKEVEEHFRTLPPGVPEFDHLTPALYLLEHGAELRGMVSGGDGALDRFEALFKDLNALLAQES